MAKSVRFLVGVCVALLTTAFVAAFANSGDYVRYMVTIISVYASLAVSLDVMVALTGRISGSHATFYGIGAYTAGFALVHHLGLIVALVMALAAAAAIAVALGYVTLRLSGIYFALGSLSFGVIFSNILTLPAMEPVTGGIFGLRGIGRPDSMSEDWQYLAAFLAVLFSLSLLKYGLSRSHVGRTLRGIRDDEELARSLGVHTNGYKIMAFAVSGTAAGLVGGLFAPFFGYLAPSMFDIWQSFNVLVWVLVGGVGSVLGPIVGAGLLWALPQVLGLQPAVTQIAYGLALILMITLSRGGLWGLTMALYNRGSRAARRRRPRLPVEAETTEKVAM